MQDYAEAVDGQCSVHSDPGAGTEVTAVLPSRDLARSIRSLRKKETTDGDAERDCPWCHKEVQVEAGRERLYTCSLCKKDFTYTPGPRAGRR